MPWSELLRRTPLFGNLTVEADFNVNLKNEVNIETILRELGELRAEVATWVDERPKQGSEIPSPRRSLGDS